MGAKKMESIKKIPQKTAVMPVRAPASTPAALSIYKVTGESPKNEAYWLPWRRLQKLIGFEE